jgi:hypothetical protein
VEQNKIELIQKKIHGEISRLRRLKLAATYVDMGINPNFVVKIYATDSVEDAMARFWTGYFKS